MREEQVTFSELLGKVCTSVEVIQDADGEADLIRFACSDGYVYEMYHQQDCREHVHIESINGDILELVGNPILLAEERWSGNGDEYNLTKCLGDYEDSYTWTFYTLATIKGYIDIKWYGASNGYYSESVELYKTDKKQL